MRSRSRLAFAGGFGGIVAVAIGVGLWIAPTAPATAAQIASRNCHTLVSDYPSSDLTSTSRVQAAYASILRQVEAWQREVKLADGQFTGKGIALHQRDVVTVCFLSNLNILQPRGITANLHSEALVLFPSGLVALVEGSYLGAVDLPEPGTTHRDPTQLTTLRNVLPFSTD
jgi:hypothetical protein